MIKGYHYKELVTDEQTNNQHIQHVCLLYLSNNLCTYRFTINPLPYHPSIHLLIHLTKSSSIHPFILFQYAKNAENKAQQTQLTQTI